MMRSNARLVNGNRLARRSEMKKYIASIGAILVLFLLAGCATAEKNPRTVQLFNDHLFAPPTERIHRDDVFAMSNEMRHYLQTTIAEQLTLKGRQYGLFDALYNKSQLKLSYDSERTRNAREAFAARSGNCLSLAIMTGAFAKEMGLNVRFQRVFVEPDWTRMDGVYFASGHVNITLGKTPYDGGYRFGDSSMLTIDFYPTAKDARQHAYTVSEESIIAMYMNNRAAEALVAGEIDNAYWWAREAIREDPGLFIAHNTLGVIYRHHKNLAEAETVFNYLLAREPDDTLVMSNLAIVYKSQGRVTESEKLALKVTKMQPYPPFYFFDLGQAAMRDGNFRMARDLFAKEVARAGTQSEFHFWLASAYFKLGDIKDAQKHLALANEYSATPKERALYSAKLERIKSYRN
jgi:predicted Zn-dependent protease